MNKGQDYLAKVFKDKMDIKKLENKFNPNDYGMKFRETFHNPQSSDRSGENRDLK
jgi:hypothetical protein